MNLPESFLPPDFFLRPVDEVAPELLGKGLWVRHGRHELVAEITEVESYAYDDAASHSYRGKTKRNWPMFEAGGTCYVYLIYGMHLCANVVTGAPGTPEAVLFRAATPLHGIKFMEKRRTNSAGAVPPAHKLLSGPGNLAQGLGIGLKQNGLSFFGDQLRILDLGKSVDDSLIDRSRRIGITKSAELLRRFCLADATSLSRKIKAAGSAAL